MGVAGRLLGEAAIIAGLHAAQTTAYGVESRGGLSTSDVVINKEEIYFPEVRKPDALLIMAAKGLQANLRGAHDGTLILYDPGTVDETIDGPGDKRAIRLLDISLKEFGSGDAATIVGLGAIVQLTGVVPFDALTEAVKKCLPARVHQQNLDALQLGKSLVEK
jgi:2-oxoglutarate ferredoxin oxidoreductase subunit gamma